SAGERGGAPEGWATAGTVLAMAHLEPALATLHDESRLRDAWARVAEALRREARPDAAAQAAAAYLRVAELGGDAPEQSAAAAHALEAALELSPRSLTALRAAARRKEAAGDLTGAAVLREREAEALGAGAGAAAADGREPPDAAAVAGDARARALALLRAATLRDAADGAVSSADKAAAWARAADAAAEAKTHASAGAADAPAPATPAADEIALWALDRAVDVDAAAADWPAFAAHARALLAQEGLDARRRLALLLTLGLVQELALGDLDDARARYEVALELEPQSRAALRGLERVAERQGQWALAASAIERRAALAADPRAAAQLHVIAAEHKLQGRAEGAHDNYRRALDVFPDHPDAVLTLGEHYRRSGELGPLEAILARRLERAADPADKAMFLVQMGEVLEERGHLADARSRYAEALAAFPEHLPALAGMRRAAQRAGDGEAFVDVTQQLAKVVKAKPQAARLWRDAAAELEQLGRTDDAEKALVRALGLDPAEEGAFRHLRRLLRTRGDDAARLALLEKRTEHARSPQERATLLFEMADVQRRVLKRPATAAQTLAKAHAEDPANLDVAEYLGDVSCELGEWGDALEAYEAVVSGTDQPPRL
ncbi:MAG TPA: hypothetical protein VG389_21960, partial [Myxococcota bacterium]|nr:hypothetical protein [Myxococcota bacterium]